MKEIIEKIALERYPENWQDEQYSPAICPKQYDINKEKREAFIDGCNYLSTLLKESLSINVGAETESDFGNVYTLLSIDLEFLGEKISTSTVQL